MGLAERDDMVGALSADGPDQPFGLSRMPIVRNQRLTAMQ
jgi:hypothetical protein